MPDNTDSHHRFRLASKRKLDHAGRYSVGVNRYPSVSIALYLAALVIFVTSILCCTTPAMAQQAEQMVQVLPAEFAFYLNLPGSSEQLSRPTAIYFDRYFGELYLADQGLNRISIYDSEGRYKYEFTGGTYFSSPVDLAVDAEGFIYVLGSSRDGRHIFKFDFDGRYVATFDIPNMFADTSVIASSFDLGPEGNLYILDQVKSRILVMNSEGEIFRSFGVLTDYTEKERLEHVLGKLRVYSSSLIVVSGSAGSAYIYDLNGQLERRVGKRGADRGQLVFPAAAAMFDNGTVIILDRRSHNYVIYDSLSRPLAEVGGRGESPGWFYQPSLLEIDDQGRVIIGQIYKNRVQVCTLPDLDVFKRIISRRVRLGVNPSDLDDMNNKDIYNSIQFVNTTKRASDATKHLNAISITRIPRRYF